MEHRIQCRCGQLQGTVSEAQRGVRAVCYCRDCQAFAHALGAAGTTLDPQGGTEVVATQAGLVRFSSSATLGCLSLSDKGLLRWYATCCNTPIGNTPRDRRMAFVGLVHTGLEAGGDLERSFGPLRMRVFRRNAKGHVADTGYSYLGSMLRLAPRLLLARLTGGYRSSPFFDAQGQPVVAPRVLTAAEREQATQAV